VAAGVTVRAGGFPMVVVSMAHGGHDQYITAWWLGSAWLRLSV
jgi:hypothetical protein